MNAQPVDVLAVLDTAENLLEVDGNPATAKRVREARAAVAELVEDLKRIQRRAAPHPDDDDADRKRNLYHVESISRLALARVQGGAA